MFCKSCGPVLPRSLRVGLEIQCSNGGLTLWWVPGDGLWTAGCVHTALAGAKFPALARPSSPLGPLGPGQAASPGVRLCVRENV